MPGAEDARLAEDVAVDLGLRPPLIEAMKRRYEEAPLAARDAGWPAEDTGRGTIRPDLPANGSDRG
jgi:hypothetical protein